MIVASALGWTIVFGGMIAAMAGAAGPVVGLVFALFFIPGLLLLPIISRENR